MKGFGAVVNHFVMMGNILRMLRSIVTLRYGALERLLFRMTQHVTVNVILSLTAVIAQVTLKLPEAFVQMNYRVLS